MTVAYEEWTASSEWTHSLHWVSDTSQSAQEWFRTPNSLLYVVIACDSGGRRSREKNARNAYPKPRTPLGERLWAARARILAEGGAGLDWDEVEREVRERRGERDDEVE